MRGGGEGDATGSHEVDSLAFGQYTVLADSLNTKACIVSWPADGTVTFRLDSSVSSHVTWGGPDGSKESRQ